MFLSCGVDRFGIRGPFNVHVVESSIGRCVYVFLSCLVVHISIIYMCVYVNQSSFFLFDVVVLSLFFDFDVSVSPLFFFDFDASVSLFFFLLIFSETLSFDRREPGM